MWSVFFMPYDSTISIWHLSMVHHRSNSPHALALEPLKQRGLQHFQRLVFASLGSVKRLPETETFDAFELREHECDGIYFARSASRAQTRS